MRTASPSPALATRFADEFNIPFGSVEFTRTQCGRVRDACAVVGRDPETPVCSNALVLCCGLGRHADAGASRVYLQVLDLSDLEHLALVAGEVVPQP